MKDMYDNYEALGMLVKTYDEYVSEQKENGKQPVSLFKYVFGQF